MKRPKVEDFHDWCPKCKGDGKVPVRFRRGGWAGENVTKFVTCDVCKGTKVFDDMEAYYKEVELYIDWLEQQIDE